MTTTVPTVSVVIVTYNKADTIAAAIDSVLAQTYQDLEVLVVDDGSTDETAARVKGYGDRVRYLPKTNGGTGSARNVGIANARGRFIAFLDGDDLWLPTKLEIQLAVFEREPHILAVQCSAYCVDNTLQAFEARRCDPRRDTVTDFLLFRNLPAFSSAIVVRRECFERIGGFGTDLVILSDWDMACRIAHAGILRSTPEFLVLYRHYPNNQSRNVDIHIDSGTRSLTRFFANPALAPELRKQRANVWAHFYAMLAGGYVRNHQWRQGMAWATKALRSSPRVIPYIAGMPMRRLTKLLEPRRQRSFAAAYAAGRQAAPAFTDSRSA